MCIKFRRGYYRTLVDQCLKLEIQKDSILEVAEKGRQKPRRSVRRHATDSAVDPASCYESRNTADFADARFPTGSTEPAVDSNSRGVESTTSDGRSGFLREACIHNVAVASGSTAEECSALDEGVSFERNRGAATEVVGDRSSPQSRGQQHHRCNNAELPARLTQASSKLPVTREKEVRTACTWQKKK